MIRDTAHKELIRCVSEAPLTEDEALSWMILLHTHEIHLRTSALDSDLGAAGQSEIVLPPETQRGAAEIVAALWPDRTDGEHSSYTYSYEQYNTKTPYEVVDDIPKDRLGRVIRLKNILGSDDRVFAVVEG
jgi:hypothetical protein